MPWSSTPEALTTLKKLAAKHNCGNEHDNRLKSFGVIFGFFSVGDTQPDGAIVGHILRYTTSRMHAEVVDDFRINPDGAIQKFFGEPSL
jgi:hypothetical protein